MTYLALGCAILAVLVWMGRGGRPVLKRREWRLLSGAVSVASFAAAAWVGVRGEWPVTVMLAVVGLWLASTTRAAGATPPPVASAPRVSEADARSILGVGPNASKEDIQAAYARLMRLAHPDKGGTDGLAAQLNAARDRLLNK